MNQRQDPLDPQHLVSQAAWLRSLARRLVRDADAAEDVVQDTLVAALEHGPRDDDSTPGGLRAWLATVARNFARKRQRSSAARRYHETHAQSLAASRTERFGDSVAADELDRLRSQRELANAIIALQEPHRSAVVLRFQKGLSYRALAKRLSVSEPAARKRVSRGVALLRAQLDEAYGGDRELWCSALVLFAMRPSGVAASTVTIGGITMGTKTTWIALAATLALSAGWLLVRKGEVASAPETDSAKIERAAPALQAPVAQKEGLHVPERLAVPEIEPPAQAPTSPEETIDAERLLSGRVVSEDGAPIPGARVEIRRDELRGFSTLDLQRSERGKQRALLETDENGRFQIEVLRGHPYDIEASSAGFAPALELAHYSGEDVEIELRAGARFRGRVVREDGSSVARALIRATRRKLSASVELFSGVTDERGRFDFGDLQAGEVRVQVLPEVDEWIYARPIVLAPGETTEETFTVKSGYTVVGRVVDATNGLPISGAEVGQGWTLSKSAYCAEDGTFELRGFALEGVYDVHARAPGYARGSHNLPSAVDNIIQVDFALEPALGASGRVVDSNGAPIVDAYVAALSIPDWFGTTTDSNGRFDLQGLAPNQAYGLFLVAEGYGTTALEFPRPLLGSGEYRLGDVELHPAALLRGRVVDVSGAPLSDVPVVLLAEYADRTRLSGPLEQLSGKSYVDEREGRTDEHGRVSFGDLGPGTYYLAGGVSGQHLSRSEPIRIEPGEEAEGVEIVLDAGLEIAGIVVDEAGEPVQAVVSIFPEPPTEGRMAQTFTGPDGRFSEEGFAQGTYRFNVFPTEVFSGSAPNDVLPLNIGDVDPFGGELRLVLPTASLTSGVVVDSRGQPVAQTIVTAFSVSEDPERIATAFTDGSGAFTLRLPPGSIVNISTKLPAGDAPFYEANSDFAEGSVTQENVEAGATHLRLELPGTLGD